MLAGTTLGLVAGHLQAQPDEGRPGNQDKPPNILFILTDQHRFDGMGCAGNPFIQTPNLDALAACGRRFTKAYCPSPACGPSRASLFTGVYPASSGHRRNADVHHADLALFTEGLRSMGYQTALVGKRHLHPIEAKHGFEHVELCDAHYDTYDKAEGEVNDYFDYLASIHPEVSRDALVHEGGSSERLGWTDSRFWLGDRWQPDVHHLTSWTSRQACRFLENRNPRQPYFLNVSFFGPHHPYTSAWPWTDVYREADVPLPDTLWEPKSDPIFERLKGPMRTEMAKWDKSVWSKFIAQYYGYISQLDRAIGEIITALKNNGDWENTWIVFASDHGDHMGNWGLLGKADPYETSARIPLIIRAPNDVATSGPGKVCNKNVNLLDLYSTFLEIGGVSSDWIDDGIESRSLVSLARDPDADWDNQTALFWGRERNNYSSAHWIDEWKVIRLRTSDEELFEVYKLKEDAAERNDLYPMISDTEMGQQLMQVSRSWGQEQERRFR